MKSPAHWENDTLILNLHVQPRASRTAFAGEHDGCIKLRTTAPPVDGKANREIIAFLSKQFRTAKSNICLMRGANSREKQFAIHGIRQIPPGLPIPESSGHKRD
ncbi:MAG: YggU family protein [Gammaproteobacteria bacterium]|nr:MAG: YggU family protein [Gammaproteobacteria bacterium]